VGEQVTDPVWAGPGPIQSGTTMFRMEPRTISMIVAGFTTVFLLAVLKLLPVPYVALRPGPVVNTLGSSGSQPLISIPGHKTYPAKGQLDLTTVSLVGGPQQPIHLQEALTGWLDGSVAVVPTDEIFPPGQTQQQTDRENAQEMADSQQAAAAAALTQLGISVQSTLKVTGLVAGAAAAAVIKPEDQILAVDGKPATQLDQLRSLLSVTKVGQSVRVTIKRAGKQSDVTARTTAGEDGRSALGVFIGRDYTLPFRVKIQINDIGGPSAGMMFALGIIDLLTPGDLTGGQRIAGTGTMDDEQGTVGAIGGIRQKLVGARRAGARFFLAPASNCDEVVGQVPDGLRVVKVATLSQAELAVQAIASGRSSSLAGC
jgi:Lon-like protease